MTAGTDAPRARGLTRGEVDRFLATPVIARLATVKPDGAPHVVPIWQHWDGEHMWVIPRARSSFVEHLRREPRVCVSCADNENADHTRVTVEGRAEIVEGPVPLAGRTKAIADAMAVRYGGPEGAAYAARTADRPRYLVRITPEKVTSWRGAEWHRRHVRGRHV